MKRLGDNRSVFSYDLAVPDLGGLPWRRKTAQHFGADGMQFVPLKEAEQRFVIVVFAVIFAVDRR